MSKKTNIADQVDILSALYNQDAEAMLLGSILSRNNDYYTAASIINGDTFYFPAHKDVWEAIEKTINSGFEASPLTLKAFFEKDERLQKVGGAAYLLKMCGMSSGVLDIRSYARTLRELHQRRVMYYAMENLKDRVLRPAPGEEAEALVAALFDEIGDVSSGGRVYQSQMMIGKQIAEELSQDYPAYSTGFRELDISMGGGLYPRRSYCIMARPKSCKTTLMGTISTNLTDAGVPNVYIAAEMGAFEIMQRVIARKAGYNSLAFATMRKKGEFVKAVIETVAKLSRDSFLVDAPYVKFDDLKRIVHTGIRKHGVKVVFLDYIQLVKGKDRNDSLVEHHEAVAAWLAEIGRKEDICVVYAAQQKEDGKVRGGDAVGMNVDQLYSIEYNKDEKGVWLRHELSRYTPLRDVGDEINLAFRLEKNGPHLAPWVPDELKIDNEQSEIQF